MLTARSTVVFTEYLIILHRFLTVLLLRKLLSWCYYTHIYHQLNKLHLYSYHLLNTFSANPGKSSTSTLLPSSSTTVPVKSPKT